MNEGTSSPLSPAGLRDLFFQPSRFFARGMQLAKRPEVYFAGWIAGMALVIDRIDQQLIRAELRGKMSDIESLGMSWLMVWLMVVLGGILAGWLTWVVGGWWYRVRLEWSGAVAPDKTLVRGVYIYQDLVQSIPAILFVVIQTFVYANYVEAWNDDAPWPLLLIIFIFWSCVTSYIAVTTVFSVSRLRAAIWFFILPLVVITFVMGALAIVAAFFTGGA